MFEIQQTDTFRKWIAKLKDKVAVAIIVSRLVRLESGYLGDAKPVGAGISELRIHHGPGYRVYFRREGERIIVLLCGGDKDSQQRDIQRARQLAVQWNQDNEQDDDENSRTANPV